MSTYDDEDYESFDLDDSADSADDADDPDADVDADDDDDELDDLTEDEIDFVVAVYREDGDPVVTALAKDLANDLDELINQLRRLPGDAGAIGMASLDEDVFVIVRVRGRLVQVLSSDASAAADYPIVRDIADHLQVAEIPDEDDESEPLGDLDLLSDLGVSSLALSLFCDTDEDDPADQLGRIADQLKVGAQFRKVVDAELGD